MTARLFEWLTWLWNPVSFLSLSSSTLLYSARLLSYSIFFSLSLASEEEVTYSKCTWTSFTLLQGLCLSANNLLFKGTPSMTMRWRSHYFTLVPFVVLSQQPVRLSVGVCNICLMYAICFLAVSLSWLTQTRPWDHGVICVSCLSRSRLFFWTFPCVISQCISPCICCPCLLLTLSLKSLNPNSFCLQWKSPSVFDRNKRLAFLSVDDGLLQKKEWVCCWCCCWRGTQVRKTTGRLGMMDETDNPWL